MRNCLFSAAAACDDARMKRLFLFSLSLSLVFSGFVRASGQVVSDAKPWLDGQFPSLLVLYKTLHAHPELSFHETNTSARIAAEWRQAGYAVTTNVGGFGVVAVLKNGAGHTLLLRTELDALPVTEETGLPFASTVTARDDSGKEVGVAHACGHDIHMTSLVGTARLLAQWTNRWHGTLVLIAQPAEERGGGAKAMIADGLFTRFPRPDYCVAFHDSAEEPAGLITYASGYSSANADSVDITVRGVGGHGAYPHKTKDPIVLAAEIILNLQTIVSRETRPGDAVVVTVGTIHGGTKNNVIPDEVKMQLTVRTYGDDSRRRTLEAIQRIVRGCAITAGIPDDLMPVVKMGADYTPSLYNDPKLTQRVVGVLSAEFGATNVVAKEPGTGAEDFSRYGRTPEKIPIFMFNVGGVKRDVYAAAQKNGTILPSLHSSHWAPDPEPTIRTGITALTIAALDLLGNGNDAN
jgi:hippurate hydrolase